MQSLVGTNHTQGWAGVPTKPTTSTYMHQPLHTPPTLTNLLLSSTNLVRRPYMHGGCPRAGQFQNRARTTYSKAHSAGSYVQRILLEASYFHD